MGQPILLGRLGIDPFKIMRVYVAGSFDIHIDIDNG